MDNYSKGSVLGVVAVAIAVIAIGVSVYGGGQTQAPDGQNVGGERAGLQEFIDGIKPGDQTVIWKKGTIGAGQNQGSWRNNLGKTVFVDLSEVYTTGTASSSIKIYVATSSSATLSSDFAAPFASGIDGKAVATSTVLTNFVYNSSKDAGTNGRHVFPVVSGEYVVTAILQDTTACLSGGAGLACESATSTSRGFSKVFWHLRINY